MSIQIMAIINTSPDSFNKDGVNIGNETALRQRVEAAIAEGADILDIGGQSTRPGAEVISAADEQSRVIPAIMLARDLTNIPISIDTFKPLVAAAALKAGASLINDVHGCEDLMMRQLVAHSGVRVVIMHSRGTPTTMSRLTHYPGGVVGEVKNFLLNRAQDLETLGVSPGNIIIDPGIGFAKTAAQSFELTREMRTFAKLGYKVLYGASQKSFLGKALATNGVAAPLEERRVATAVVQSYAMLHGAGIIRAHDVKAAVQTRAIVEALQSTDKEPLS
ncbi:MAG: Dihydropteroate synthase [Patescibacteria group bacterium]|nr:Dihydropteroate synthase [Patescibacteria group bacterium]